MSAEPGPGDPAPGRVRTLLLVIGDPARAQLYRHLSERAGLRAIEADGALHALTFLEREPPDAIICEPDMADMDGEEFRTVVHEEVGLSELPVFVLADGRELVRHRQLEFPALTAPEVMEVVLDELEVSPDAFPVPVRRPEHPHLQGHLDPFNLPELLMWLYEMESSGHWLLTITDDEGDTRQAHLLMTGGDLTYAEYAGVTGKAALFSALRDVTLHPHTAFEFVRDEPLALRSSTLQKNTPRTLMELAVNLDHLDAQLRGLNIH